MKFLKLFMVFAFSACASINNEDVNFKKVSIDEPVDITTETQFVSEDLSTVHLKAFEKRAMEKLKDFADYLDIISDKSYEEEFRSLAVKQARSLFIEHSEIKLDEENSKRVDHFLNDLRNGLNQSKISIHEISIAEKLNESIGYLFEGTLSFSYSDVASDHQKIAQKKVEFFLMRTPKSFGSNQKMVWEVFLGDIY